MDKAGISTYNSNDTTEPEEIEESKLGTIKSGDNEVTPLISIELTETITLSSNTKVAFSDVPLLAINGGTNVDDEPDIVEIDLTPMQ